MGNWNPFGRRRTDELRQAQREEAEINAQFRREVNRTIKRHEEEMSQILGELEDQKKIIRNLTNQIRSLKRDQSSEAKRNMEKYQQDLEIAERERKRKEEEKNIKENEKELSEAEYREAKKYVAQVKEKIESAIEEKNEVRLENEEKKLKELLLIFKKRFKDQEYKDESFKKLKLVSEILFNVADYYFDSRKYKKALEFFLETEEFSYNKKYLLFDRIVRCNYEIGKYEEAWEYLNKLSEKNIESNDKDIINAELLRLEIYIKLDKYQEARESIFKLKDILVELNDKSNLKIYAKYLTDYLKEKKEEDITSLLFFSLLYLRDFKTIENLIKNFEFTEKKFFEGVVLLRGNNKEAGFALIKNYLDTIYGSSFYFSNIQSNFKIEDLNYLNNFINLDIKNINSGNYIIDKNDLMNKKYEFLGYKIEFLFKQKIIDFNKVLEEINNLFNQDKRDKKFKGNNIFWVNIFKIVEYLKNTDNILAKDFEKIIYFHLEEDTIKAIKLGIEDPIEIDIENEYKILEEKSKNSFYKERVCENNLTKKKKVFIEYFEPMSISGNLNRRMALTNDKLLGEKSDCFLKIDNFSVEDSTVKIIMDNYDATYEDVVGDYYNLTFDEKIEKAFNILNVFKELAKEGKIVPKLNIDNLVIKDNEYKFRLLNFTKSLEGGSLNSTKSTLNKKSSRYKSPEITIKQQSLESNIFVLGLLFYDIFYGEDILKGVIDPSLSKKEVMEVQDAFYEGLSIKKSLVFNNKSERFYSENLEKKTVKLRKVLEKYYVPQDITNLLEELLSSDKLLRPTLKEIEEKLEEVKINTKNFNGFIPNNFLKKDLEKFVKSIFKNIEKFVVREEKLKEIYSNTILDENAPALMVITLKDGKNLEISDLGKIYTVLLVEEEDILEKNSKKISFEDIKQKLEEILDKDEKIESFAKNNNAEIENAQYFLYYINERLESFKNKGILELTNEDLNLFLNIPTISKNDAKKIIKENNIDELLRVLNEVV
ncbi:hypothetical protein [Fusobacterium sp. HC1336]|uniref:hypothetical protein n=1 Tax=Fusobacterium sp. HC1336 TaxID=3171169 RepID=UPI003F26E312